MFHFLNKNLKKHFILPLSKRGIEGVFQTLTKDLFIISAVIFIFFLLLSQSNPEQIGYSVVYKIFGISSIALLILMFRHQILHFLKTDPNPQIKTILGDLSLISLIIFAIFSWINYTNPIYTQTTETLTNPEALQSTSKLIPGTFVFLIISLTSLILFLKDKIHRNFDEFLKYGFLISLLTVTLGSLNFEFIQTAPFLNNIVTFLKTYLLPISIISITFGFFLFYRNHENVNLEIEKNKEKHKFKNFISILIIFSIFLSIRFFFILKYPGNFADDWQHIIAGSTFFENGHFHRINTQFENGYMRGAYVSFTVAVFFYLFGKTLFVAKLIPVLIGSINFLLFYFISKKLFKNNLFIYLGLLIFAFNPWSIFNHIYIRTYVFFELFLLLSIFIFIKILDAIKKNKNKALIIYFIILALINYLNWFWSYDTGKYTILIANLVGLSYLFFFEIQKIKFGKKDFLTREISYIKNLSFAKKFYLWFSLSIVFLLVNIKKIKWTLNAEAPAFRSDKGYFEFFFETNVYLMLFFILSILFIFKTKNTYSRIVFFVGVLLLMVHFSLNSSLQVIRGILYFIPLFLLISVYSLNILFKIILNKKNYLKYLLFFIIIPFGLVINIKNNFPEDFFSVGPSIKHEVGYADYSKTYQYIKENLPNKKILQADYNIMAELFFDLKTSYKIDLNNTLENSYTHEYNKTLGKNFQIPTQTPVIIKKEEFYDFVKNNEVCIVTRPISEERFFTPETWSFLEKNLKKKVSYNTFSIYCD